MVQIFRSLAHFLKGPFMLLQGGFPESSYHSRRALVAKDPANSMDRKKESDNVYSRPQNSAEAPCNFAPVSSGSDVKGLYSIKIGPGVSAFSAAAGVLNRLSIE